MTVNNNEPVFVGREHQLKELRKLLYGDNPEFIAVYGRRRVGKTFLVKKAAENNFAFYFTATSSENKLSQLTSFAIALKKYSGSDTLSVASNWLLAFDSLGEYIEKLPQDENKILFFDELPWADTPKSGFYAAFENFWNTRCAFRKDIKVVVCGSATSWIINKIIRNRGGLHGRLTHSFLVEPFNLHETEEYFKSNLYLYRKKELAEIYMIMGGIPYYFSLMDRGEGVSKNIDRLFFSPGGQLKTEFDVLYGSLFKNPEPHLAVIKELAKKRKGLTRQQLIKNLKITGNGGFSNVLRELQECGFIKAYVPFETKVSESNKAKRHCLYQLIDLYSLFYLKFIKENIYQDTDFWTSNVHDPKLNTWRGLAFETLCLWHLPQIKASLGISGLSSRTCCWDGKNAEEEKSQIDLLIDRKDGVINICEMKYSVDEFVITSSYAKSINRKVEVFVEATKTRKTPVITFITNNGIKNNAYSWLAQKEVMLKELFRY